MKLVFIVGTGRCGSTFVHEVLARHEAMGFVSNIEDNLPLVNTLGRWNNALYRSPLGSFTRKGSLRFAPSEAYRLIGREVSPIYADPCRDLSASDVTPWLERRFREFFERRAVAQAKPVFSQKYTGWPRIGFFGRIFPEARFINVVRDGRAVANSWLQMSWWGGYRGPENWLWGPLSVEQREEWRASGYSFPRLAALSWKILMTAFHHAESELGGDRYLKIRYEDILKDPEQQFERMLRFCSLTATPGFRKALFRQQIRRDRARAFERDLTQAQLSELEESLGDLLAQYNYL